MKNAEIARNIMAIVEDVLNDVQKDRLFYWISKTIKEAQEKGEKIGYEKGIAENQSLLERDYSI